MLWTKPDLTDRWVTERPLAATRQRTVGIPGKSPTRNPRCPRPPQSCSRRGERLWRRKFTPPNERTYITWQLGGCDVERCRSRDRCTGKAAKCSDFKSAVCVPIPTTLDNSSRVLVTWAVTYDCRDVCNTWSWPNFVRRCYRAPLVQTNSAVLLFLSRLINKPIFYSSFADFLAPQRHHAARKIFMPIEIIPQRKISSCQSRKQHQIIDRSLFYRKIL